MPVTVHPHVIPARPVKKKSLVVTTNILVSPKKIIVRPVTVHRIVAALPIVMVNIVAVTGQFQWAREHLPTWDWYGQIVFAIALETIALTLAYHAHLAETENDSALGLKLASYGFGLLIGTLNFSHYSHEWQPNAVALVVGMMSSVSPVLWGIYSRRVSRNRLLANGLIDRHSIRLGMTRWVWHPIRSARVTYAATWNGETHVARAIDRYNREANERLAARAARKAAQEIDNDVRRLATS
jgi:hypothetical protein